MDTTDIAFCDSVGGFVGFFMSLLNIIATIILPVFDLFDSVVSSTDLYSGLCLLLRQLA